MHFRLFFSISALGAVLATTLVGEEVLKFKDVEFKYSAIRELKIHTAGHLKNLDANIESKDQASKNPLNPFHEKAAIRLAQLKLERGEFLKLTWQCPHWAWVKCNHCDGGKKTWWVGDDWLNSGPCKKCGGKNGYKVHVHAQPHPDPDRHEKCNVSIGSLLGVE